MLHSLKPKKQYYSMDIQGLIFDMDGTLVETEQAGEQIWRRWANRHGLDVVPLLNAARGRRTIDTIREFCPDRLSVEEETAIIEQEELDITEGIFAVSGALTFLKSIPIERWAIVTSNTRQLANIRLRTVGIEQPNILITSDDVLHGKPDPEGYLKAADALGYNPNDIVIFEDSRVGVEAARASGASVVVIEQLPELNGRYGERRIANYDGLHLSLLEDGRMRLDIPDSSK